MAAAALLLLMALPPRALRQIKKFQGPNSAARGSIAACNRPISAPYDMHRRAQGGREPLSSDGKDDRAEYEHDLSSPAADPAHPVRALGPRAAGARRSGARRHGRQRWRPARWASCCPATDLLVRSLAYELPKSAGYWVPWALAIAAGIGLAAFWGMRDLPGWVRVGAVSAFVVLSAVSFQPDALEPEAIEQHRYAETLADLARQRPGRLLGGLPGQRGGSWMRHGASWWPPCAAEIGAGRLGARRPVLHVAPTLPAVGRHAAGRVHRGHGDDRHARRGAQHPHPGRPAGAPRGPGTRCWGRPTRTSWSRATAQPMVDRVKAAGYTEVWRNDRAVLLRRSRTADAGRWRGATGAGSDGETRISTGRAGRWGTRPAVVEGQYFFSRPSMSPRPSVLWTVAAGADEGLHREPGVAEGAGMGQAVGVSELVGHAGLQQELLALAGRLVRRPARRRRC